MITPGNYFGTEKKKKRKFGITTAAETFFIDTLLLLPAVWFWTSVILKAGLGSDYFYDVIFEQMSQNFWGNLILIFFVVGLPGLCVGTNWILHKKWRDNIAWWGMGIAVLFLVAGIVAIVRRG